MISNHELANDSLFSQKENFVPSKTSFYLSCPSSLHYVCYENSNTNLDFTLLSPGPWIDIHPDTGSLLLEAVQVLLAQDKKDHLHRPEQEVNALNPTSDAIVDKLNKMKHHSPRLKRQQ